jgi:hypothetical protein
LFVLVGVSGSIFLVRGDVLVELRPTGYASEAVLQELIARFPNLLAGDDSGAAERRWLLVGRESGLPDQEQGSARWAVDHLLLDQDAIPTIVEVKLAQDTRIRREVVGQMLDYAANAVVYWPIDRLRERFVRECNAAGRDPAALVAEAAGEDVDPDRFWQRAEENLRAGKLRLVFVADEIPRELRRVIEFLNGQMVAEVIGLEVKQYAAEDVTTLVPALVGQTAEAEVRKGRAPSRQWSAGSFFAALAERQPAAEVAAARALYEWTLEHGWTASFGRGAEYGSWTPVLTANGRDYRPLTLYTTGSLTIPFQTLASRPPFDNRDTRLELMQRLNEIAGVAISPDSIDSRYPSFPLSTITGDDGALDQLTRTLAWVAETAA